LYQHPPQARRLADVLQQLAANKSQVLVTTHSPYFVSGAEFESVRLIRKASNPVRAEVHCTTHKALANFLISYACTNEPAKPQGIRAKINQSLQWHINEMFFCRFPVLVEGLEDVAYITTALHLYGYWNRFHSSGCHLIAANGKGHLIHPAALARLMSIPFFLLFDCDGDCKREDHRGRHEPENKTLFKIAGVPSDIAFPDEHVREARCWAWTSNLGRAVEDDFDITCLRAYQEKARKTCGHASSLDKNSLFISEWLTVAYEDGKRSSTLDKLCGAIIQAAAAGVEA
jgi:predicted ATP-dependent endonuclease of OLD family